MKEHSADEAKRTMKDLDAAILKLSPSVLHKEVPAGNQSGSSNLFGYVKPGP